MRRELSMISMIAWLMTPGCSPVGVETCDNYSADRQIDVVAFQRCPNSVVVAGACEDLQSEGASVGGFGPSCSWAGKMTGALGSTCVVTARYPDGKTCTATATLRGSPSCNDQPAFTLVYLERNDTKFACYDTAK